MRTLHSRINKTRNSLTVGLDGSLALVLSFSRTQYTLHHWHKVTLYVIKPHLIQINKKHLNTM